MEAEERGLGQEGILSAILEDTKGVDRTTAIIGLKKRLGITTDSARKLYEKYNEGYEPLMKHLENLEKTNPELAKKFKGIGTEVEVKEDRIHDSNKIRNKLMEGYKDSLITISGHLETMANILDGLFGKKKTQSPITPFPTMEEFKDKISLKPLFDAIKNFLNDRKDEIHLNPLNRPSPSNTTENM